MLKESIKQFFYISLYKPLTFNTRRLLANSLLYSILRSASDDDLVLLEDAFTSLDFVQVQIEDRIREIKHSGRRVSSRRTRPILTSVIDDKAPWLENSVEQLTMPGMISDEEAQYYEYIGTLYEGLGAAIELGPWLGKSTRHIIRGLRKSPQFNNKKLFVFDDFIWRKSWMDRHTPEQLRLPNHSDFRALFESFVKDIQTDLIISTARIADYDGNEHLPRIAWNDQPIEIMYIDCGRTIQVNEGWFEVFSQSFIPDVTLLVMQDWRSHRERPRLSYNQTLWFTTSHPESELIHEGSEGGIATFLYRGCAPSS
jgi:hypothetical protein